MESDSHPFELRVSLMMILNDGFRSIIPVFHFPNLVIKALWVYHSLRIKKITLESPFSSRPHWCQCLNRNQNFEKKIGITDLARPIWVFWNRAGLRVAGAGTRADFCLAQSVSRPAGYRLTDSDWRTATLQDYHMPAVLLFGRLGYICKFGVTKITGIFEGRIFWGPNFA